MLTSSLLGLAAYAQGTVNFANLGVGLNKPIYMGDGTTKVGTGFTVELLAGFSANSLQLVATTGFFPTAPGYFSGGVVTINGMPGGSAAVLQVRVWLTAAGSFPAAQAAGQPNTWGASAPFAVTLGGGGNPPALPASLSTLQSFTVGWGMPPPLTQEFYYVTNDGTITITKYNGPGGGVSIPSEINGLPVTAIGNFAFVVSHVMSVEIPDTVVDIGDGAFSYCSSLGDVNLGHSVTNIGNSAFKGCALSSVAIPDSVIRIGDGAFWGCGSMASLTLGNGIVYIGDEAFQDCSGLSTAITILKGSIGGNAFENTGVTNVTIGSGVTSVGGHAFYGCAHLTGVTIGSGVTNIGVGVFAGCTSLTAISVDELNTRYSSLDGVLFNKNQTTLMGYPGGRAGHYDIPAGVLSIWPEAFAGCARLISVTIPNSVTSIGYRAFGDCTRLAAVTIPNKVTNIDLETFQFCTSLSSVVIGNNVTNIDLAAFTHCGSLTNVTIPNSVTSISDYAFVYCTNLASVILPNRLISIGPEAFGFCPRLSSVIIPAAVNSIGWGAFGECTDLSAVYFLGNAPAVEPGALLFPSNTTVYYLPGTSGWQPTFGGSPTVPWVQAPDLLTPPHSQTAEAASAADFWVNASSPLPLFYFWYFNSTNLLSVSTNSMLQLDDVQPAQAGTYSVVVSNVLGAITSAPVMLNVLAPVERRPVPGIKVAGEAGTVVNIDYASSLSPVADWTTLGSVSLASTSQYWFDLTLPLPAQRFYRAWQTGAPDVTPSIEARMVPAITLMGNIGDSLRLDYINRFGPTDAWVPLDTVTLTNTSQLYFDTSAIGQPQRLWRIVPVP